MQSQSTDWRKQTTHTQKMINIHFVYQLHIREEKKWYNKDLGR